MSFLDPLLRKIIKIAGGSPLRERRVWNLVSGATAVDNPDTGETDITFAGGGGLLPGDPDQFLQTNDAGDNTQWVTLTQDMIAAAYAVSLSLTGSALVEVSQSVVTPAFTASYVRTPVAAVLTDTIPTTPKNVIGTPTSFSSNGTFQKTSYGQSVTFTLTANEAGGSSKTSSASITWVQKVYYGAAVPATLNEAFIEALATGTLATGRARSFTVTAGATEKIYYAFRSAYGTPTFTVGGFAGGFSLAASGVSVTNAHGFTENYDVWASDNLNLGTTDVVVS